MKKWFAVVFMFPPLWKKRWNSARTFSFFSEEEQGIPVIRLGLHASPDLERHRVAGPWHPAFRQLCEGRIYRKRAASLLRDKRVPPGPVRIFVHPRALSAMIGQRKSNLQWFGERGYAICVAGDPGISRYQVKLGAGTE